MFKNIFLISCIIAAVNTENVNTEVSKPCTWGSSYWCTSVKAAKDCGAVQFCIRNTWRQQNYVQDIHEDDTCAFCQKMVTDIKDYVTSDQSEQAILAFADEACAKLSDKFIADECKGIANLYIVQIISMLRQNMQPVSVCKAINLCATGDMFISPVNYRPYYAVSQNVLTRMAVDKLKKAHVNGVFRALANNTAKYGDNLPKTQLRTFVGTAADQCDTCKQGVEDLKIVFANSQVRDEVAQILKTNICPRFILPAECKKLIDDYAPEIFQVIINLDPEAACETIGLCTVTASSLDSAKPAILPMVQVKPAEIASNRPVRTLKVQASVQCVLCEYVLSTIMQALQNNATDQQIIDTVTHICNILPSTVKSECQQFVAEYGEELIDLLTHSTDPQTICTLIGICSNQETEEAPQQVSMGNMDLSEALKAFTNIGPVLNSFGENSYETRTNKDDKKVSDDNKCFMCRIVANYLISILNENYTAQAVEGGLEKVCNFLPGKMAKECDVFIDKYTPQLMASIMSSLNTQTICQSIDLCTPTAAFVDRNGKVTIEELVVAPFAY